MKRPKKVTTTTMQCVDGQTHELFTVESYLCTDIDPLLDRLEAYERIIPDPYATYCGQRIEVGTNKPAPNFPTLEEFEEWYCYTHRSNKEVHNYFSQFQYETKVFPKVGEEYEFRSFSGGWYKGKLHKFKVETPDAGICGETDIRPVTAPTREEVIEKYGLSEQEIEILKG